MAAEKFGHRVQDDVRAPLNRSTQIRCRKGVVDEQRQSALVRDAGDGLDVEHIAAGIADRFAEECLGIAPNRGFPRAEIVRVHPCQLDRKLAQDVLELVDRPAVQRRGGHDVVPGFEQREQRGGLRGQATGKRDGAAAVLQAGGTLFECGHRRIHDPGVGIAVLLQVKVCGRRLRVLEYVARRLENRHSPCASIGIRALASMQLTGLEAESSGLFQGRRSRLR